MFVDIISMRRGARQPARHYSVVRVDRNHSVLSNRHEMVNKNDHTERQAVIRACDDDLRRDEVINGPMTQAIDELCERVDAGEYIALACWCDPLPCHAELIRDRMSRRLGRDLRPKG